MADINYMIYRELRRQRHQNNPGPMVVLCGLALGAVTVGGLCFAIVVGWTLRHFGL